MIEDAAKLKQQDDIVKRKVEAKNYLENCTYL
jgi:hypothetical protein